MRHRRKPVPPGKKRYSIAANVTITVCTEVDATSEAKAREIALNRGMQSLCRRCASGEDVGVEWCLTGSIDGEVDEYSIVEVTVSEVET